MLQRANNALGTQYVAAFTASMRVKYLFTCVFENIGVAMATYCGQNLGAGRIDRIRQGLRAALRITAVYFLFTLAVIYPLADKLMLLFVDPSEQLILAEAARFLRTCNYFYPVLGLLTVLRYSIQGMGYAHLSMLSGVMEMLARTGVSLWLVPAFGFTGVIMGDPVAWLSADAFLVPCMLLLLRHQRKKEGAVGLHDRQILRLALPSIVQNITVPLLGLCDVAIVGHIGDATYIGAIAVGSMIFNVMYWLFGFLRMGTSGLTAQARGARHFAQAMAVLRQGLLFGVGVGLLIIVMQLPIRWLSFSLMRPTADVATLCHPYFAICIWGAPAMLGLYALTGWFIGMQNTRTPMLIAIVQNVVNILLSLFFVFFLHLQVEGVALGTLIAQWTGFLLALFLLKTTKSNHNYKLSTINYKLSTIN
jgi:Na+-driven multidrug efflux pump